MFGGKKVQTVALIDISSHSLGGAYAIIAPNKAPRICYTARVPLEVTYETDRKTLLRVLEQALRELTGKLENEGAAILGRACGVRHVDDVMVSVGSPWQETKIRAHSQTFAKPERVDSNDLEKSLKENEASLEVDTSRTVLIDHTIIDVLINGYQTTKPIGKRARRMSVISLASMVPLQVHDLITSYLSKVFHIRPIHMQTAPAVSYIVLRDLFAHESDFLAASVTGESTDILLVKNSIITGIVTTLEGANGLKRSVDGAVGQPTAASAQTLMATDVLHDDAREVITKATKEAENAWSRSVITSLADLARRHALPQTLFVVCPEDCRDQFVKLLQREDVHALRMGEQPFTVVGIRAQHLTDHLVFMGYSEKDVYLGFLALFINQRGGL